MMLKRGKNKLSYTYLTLSWQNLNITGKKLKSYLFKESNIASMHSVVIALEEFMSNKIFCLKSSHLEHMNNLMK